QPGAGTTQGRSTRPRRSDAREGARGNRSETAEVVMNRIDALSLTGPDLFRPARTLDEVVEQSLQLGTDGIVVAPGRPPAYHLPPANDSLASACADRERVVRLARVDPNQGDAAC